IITASNTYTVNDLPAGSTLSWKVSSNCNAAFDSWSSYGPKIITNAATNLLVLRQDVANPQMKLVVVGKEQILFDDQAENIVELKTFPNPSTNEVKISLISDNDTFITSYIILNQQGQRVLQVEGLASTSETIYLRQYGSGLYF